LALLLAALGGAGAAQADIFKCTGGDGHVTYTNQKTDKSCLTLSRDLPVSSVSGRSGEARSPTPASFPRVDNGTQRKRDGNRRRILEEELGREEKLLAEARSALAVAAPKPGARLEPLQDNIALHERNLEALRKEIGNLR
jgi:hypothetical protein